jgi:NADPH-dependent 2,4-dienoyl-CoA reductase/sulfur reductase-like enzyme
LRCAINPFAAFEDQLQITPAKKKKKVLVAGGGPGGMEAAKTAAERGHDVVLCEASESLGGMLIPASKAPHKENFEKLARYQYMELARTGVEIRRGQAVDEALVDELKPDVLIVATGSEPLRLDVPGAENGNVFGALEVLTGVSVPGERVAVIGGGLVGCETAEYLVARGKRVTIVEMLEQIAADIPVTTRSAVTENLKEAGIRTEVSARAIEFTEEGVVVERDGETFVVRAEAAILAVGQKPKQDLAEKLEGRVKEIHVVGDCAGVRRMRDAIHEGARAGLEI